MLTTKYKSVLQLYLKTKQISELLFEILKLQKGSKSKTYYIYVGFFQEMLT